MLLYYAMGGGLGHLVRARAVLHTLGLDRGPVVLLTASAHARDRRVVGAVTVHAPPDALGGGRDPAASLRAWVAAAIDRFAADELMVDAFPAGLLGELAQLPLPARTRLTHVARLLRWPAYAPHARAFNHRFARVHVVEPLHADHAAFLTAAADVVAPLALADPPPSEGGDASAAVAAAAHASLPARFTLVVHSGPPHEVAELVAYARDRALRDRPAGGVAPASLDPVVVCCPAAAPMLPEGVIHADIHPAAALFARASRIVTAAGFNVMRQLRPYAARHHFLPLPRRYDDQFTRAARARAVAAAAAAAADTRNAASRI